jgi:apolipoprotein N-acyltransferase
MVVEPHGQILYETEPFTEVVKVEELRMGRVETLYARGGWLFSWLCILGGLVGIGAARRR